MSRAGAMAPSGTDKETAMHVLLAIDGSASSVRARDLTAAARWPEGTLLRVVAAMPDGDDLAEAADDSEAAAALRGAVQAAERMLDSPSSGVDSVILRGRAPNVILEEAKSFAADLIVMGNRGQGAIATMLLGSVSAEVVDSAPCPVLVARSVSVETILLADDGSRGAKMAANVVASWPVFAASKVVVAAVVKDGHEQAEQRLAKVAALLQREGVQATTEVRQGEPAAELVAAADEHQSDLIAVGTRGLTGLRRLVLGSVARNVLTNASCSVLIVPRR